MGRREKMKLLLLILILFFTYSCCTTTPVDSSVREQHERHLELINDVREYDPHYK